MVPPALTYRARLRLEGLVLAACGVAGSVALLLADERTRQNASSTGVQLVVVLVALGVLGPFSVRRAMAGSRPVAAAPPGTSVPAAARAAPTASAASAPTGEPTPLWHLPLVVAALTVPLVALGAWDAGLRVTGGCTLVGLAQAFLLARLVDSDERATGRTYVRIAGSRILRGTRLAYEQSNPARVVPP